MSGFRVLALRQKQDIGLSDLITGIEVVNLTQGL